MEEIGTHTLAWLGNLLRLLRLPPDLVIQPIAPDSSMPPLDFGAELPAPHVLQLPTAFENQQEWQQALEHLLTHQAWDTCFINLLGVPPRTLITTRDDTHWRDGAAILIEAMYTAEPDHVVAVLCPLGLFTGNYHAPLRAWLAQHHQLEWLIYLGSAAAQLLGVHLRFRMVLLRFSSVSRQFQKSFHAVW